MSEITYHEKQTANALWLDIAFDGKLAGYIYNPHGDSFYHVQLKEHFGFNAYLTLDKAKDFVESKLVEEWEEVIQ
jgi:hypothetical protein